VAQQRQRFHGRERADNANHGSGGTHSAGSCNTDRYEENLVHIEQLAFIFSHVPTSYTQHFFHDAGVYTRGSYYPDVCMEEYEALEARSELAAALAPRVLWQCQRELGQVPRDMIRPFCITILYHNLLLFIDIFHI
jgi:hypothetical protein